MKIKIITLFIVLSFCFNNIAIAGSHIDRQIKASKNNVKYSSVEKYTTKLNIEEPTHKKLNIKDPKLIKFPKVKEISAVDYNKKIKEDETVYTKKIYPKLKRKTNSINVDPLPVDFYNLYRITEKLIRANNLDYVNWRIAVRKSTKNYNAETIAANLIIINTALYDSLCSNPDALAFVIGHEMAHQVLGHAQQIEDKGYNKSVHKNSNSDPLADLITLVASMIVEQSNSNQYRTMEYMADALGLEFIVRAGYDPQKAIETINIINAHPHKQTINSTHPYPQERINNIQETQKYLLKDIKNEGKLNIYNSEVLDCRKSSDRVSFVIIKPNIQNKEYYKVETLEEILKRVAYTDYKNGDMKKAIKNFKSLAKITESYIPYLYISYAYEYLYNETKEDKYLKRARKAVKEAEKLAPDNKTVGKQLKAVAEDL